VFLVSEVPGPLPGEKNKTDLSHLLFSTLFPFPTSISPLGQQFTWPSLRAVMGEGSNKPFTSISKTHEGLAQMGGRLPSKHEAKFKPQFHKDKSTTKKNQQM
jgi:hypothetical protein